MLAVKLETIHKPAKPPTNHSNYSQTSQTSNKSPTNQPNTGQTTHQSAKNRILYSLKTFSMIRYKFKTQKLQYWQPHTIQPFCQSWTIRKVGAFFLCSCHILYFTFSIAQFFTIPNYELQS